MAQTSVYGLRYLELTDPPDIAAGTRNLAEDVETELARIDAAVANDTQGRAVRRGERNSDFAPVDNTEKGILRVDGIPIVSGRRYAIMVSPTRVNSIVSGDIWAQRLRLNQTGTATTSSTTVAYAEMNNGRSITLYAEFTATTTGNACSVLLTAQRTSGSGAGTWHVDGTTKTITIVDLGPALGNSGVVL
ncbi:MAG: hypothetical protein IRY85_14900 [Micromonosporaceae bacterium]|nr:hypothetical protein [Micromonosporaceae bacterium]